MRGCVLDQCGEEGEGRGLADSGCVRMGVRVGGREGDERRGRGKVRAGLLRCGSAERGKARAK